MQEEPDPHNLDDVLDEVDGADANSGKIAVGGLVEAFGKKAFGPLLLLLSLIAFTPLGGIPGVPTILAAIVVVIVAQLLVGRNHIWLPGFILHREVNDDQLTKTIEWLRPLSRWIDKLIRPRLAWVLRGTFLRFAALGCIIVALTVPLLEIVPFGGTPSWAAIGLFGLAITAEDGILALISLAFAIGAVAVVYTVLF